MKTKIFYDFEATSVSRDADMISVGLIADSGTSKVKSFYAEFTDFSLDKCDDWVKENIVGKLHNTNTTLPTHDMVVGNKEEISKQLKQWLSQFEEVEFWADYDVIDKPMLIDLIAHWDYGENDFDIISAKNPTIIKRSKIGLPKHLPNVKYDQFFDLHTLLKIKGMDTDMDREEFSGLKTFVDACSEKYIEKHYALYDAHVTATCYDKLMK